MFLFIDLASSFAVAAAVALAVVVATVSWHHPRSFCSLVLLSWTRFVFELRLSQPLCVLHRTGMPSFRFRCKTSFFHLSVPFRHIQFQSALVTAQIRALQLLTQAPCAQTGFLIKGLEISHALMWQTENCVSF